MPRLDLLAVALVLTSCVPSGWPDQHDLPGPDTSPRGECVEVAACLDDAGAFACLEADACLELADVACPEPTCDDACDEALAAAEQYLDSFAGDECEALAYVESEWPDCIGWALAQAGCIP